MSFNDFKDIRHWTDSIESFLNSIIIITRKQKKKYSKIRDVTNRAEIIITIITGLIALGISAEALAAISETLHQYITAGGGFLIAGLMLVSRVCGFSSTNCESHVRASSCISMINKITMQLTLNTSDRQDARSFLHEILIEAEQNEITAPVITNTETHYNQSFV